MASGRVLKLLSQLWKAQCDAPLVCLELKKESQRLPRQTGFKADQRYTAIELLVTTAPWLSNWRCASANMQESNRIVPPVM